MLIFRLVADNGDNGTASTTVQVVIPGIPVPAPVTSISAKPGIRSNFIAWAAVSGANSYNLYWSTTPGVTPANGHKIGGITALNYIHRPLTNGVAYYYVVTAQNTSGESAASAQVSATPSIAPLVPILNLLLHNGP